MVVFYVTTIQMKMATITLRLIFSSLLKTYLVPHTHPFWRIQFSVSWPSLSLLFPIGQNLSWSLGPITRHNIHNILQKRVAISTLDLNVQVTLMRLNNVWYIIQSSELGMELIGIWYRNIVCIWLAFPTVCFAPNEVYKLPAKEKFYFTSCSCFSPLYENTIYQA